jgi:hypothetical protein
MLFFITANVRFRGNAQRGHLREHFNTFIRPLRNPATRATETTESILKRGHSGMITELLRASPKSRKAFVSPIISTEFRF